MPACLHILEIHVLPFTLSNKEINNWIKFKEYEGFFVYLFEIKNIRLAFVGIETIVFGGMYYKENKPFSDPFIGQANVVPSGPKGTN